MKYLFQHRRTDGDNEDADAAALPRTPPSPTVQAGRRSLREIIRHRASSRRGQRQLVLIVVLSVGASVSSLLFRPSLVLTEMQSSGALSALDRVAGADAAVRDLLRLGGGGKRREGDRLRSVVCAVTRNDAHLREFIVRNLLIGFDRVILYDNNRVEFGDGGSDHDIGPVVRPFVKAGAVTVVPWGRGDDPSTRLDSDAKSANARECAQTWGKDADWVAMLDIDEMLYIERHNGDWEADGDEEEMVSYQEFFDSLVETPEPRSPAELAEVSAVGTLPRMLDDLEARSPEACYVRFRWRQMYGETRVLADPNELLMDSYPRICSVDKPKVMIRPRMADVNETEDVYYGGLPHDVKCKEEGIKYNTDFNRFGYTLPEYKQYGPTLIHYDQKSVEEWLVKLEQSVSPDVRHLHLSYGNVLWCPARLEKVDYHPEYVSAVRNTMDRLRAADKEGEGDGGRFIDRPPELPKDVFLQGADGRKAQAKAARSHEMYLFFKERVGAKAEWDEEEYLRIHWDVAEDVRGGLLVDGMQHYYDSGFPDRPAFWKECNTPQSPHGHCNNTLDEL